MKNTAKLLVKGLFIIVLFTGSTIALSTVGIKTVNEAQASVTYQTVLNYLVNNGYEVVTLNPIREYKTDNWIAHTIRNGVHYMTTVYVEGTQIVGVNDIPM